MSDALLYASAGQGDRVNELGALVAVGQAVYNDRVSAVGLFCRWRPVNESSR